MDITTARWEISLMANCPSCGEANDYSVEIFSDGVDYRPGQKIECKEVSCHECDFWFPLEANNYFDQEAQP